MTKRMTRLLLLASLLLLATAPARAVDIQDLEAALTGEEEPAFLQARNRLAVFTFEDPDGIGLGDDIAFLSTARILFDAEVSSLAIILFQEGLQPGRSGLSYFEKVDQLTQDREFIAAVWGRIARDGPDLRVDSFVQFYPEAAARRLDYHEETQRFTYRFDFEALPGQLRVSLAPRRIWVRTTRLPASAADELREAALAIRTLRPTRDPASEPVTEGHLELGRRFGVLTRRGDWRRLLIYDNGVDGWTSISAHCADNPACGAVIAPIDYLNGLLRYANELTDGIEASEADTDVARAVATQIRLLDELSRRELSQERLGQVVSVADEWLARPSTPGGAAFANIRAVARLRQLRSGGGMGPEAVAGVADGLAKALLDDPDNLDALHNLGVLFAFSGDEERAALARRLYAEQTARLER